MGDEEIGKAVVNLDSVFSSGAGSFVEDLKSSSSGHLHGQVVFSANFKPRVSPYLPCLQEWCTVSLPQ